MFGVRWPFAFAADFHYSKRSPATPSCGVVAEHLFAYKKARKKKRNDALADWPS